MTRNALIVAHGQPSAPDGPEAQIGALAASVAGLLPGWQVRGATLAAPGALEAALQGLADPVIFPLFMADGWFLRRALPDRLAAAGHSGTRLTAPFGLLPETRALAAGMLARALALRGWQAGETVLICAAHGSGRSPRPAEAAREMADWLAGELGFAALRCGFIEEPPALAEVLADAGPRALCLPLFVARWGHVIEDLPRAVAAARFDGSVLPPLGSDPAVPRLIADALTRAA